MNYNNIELNVLIKGRPLTEYPSNGQVFLEGREGSAYEVQVKNNNRFRVEAVVSVDGLSVIDGKDAGPASSGYLLNAGETITIPGWKLSETQVAAFEFAGKGKSYAAQSSGSSRNTGVIGVMAFKEKETYRGQHTLIGGGNIWAQPFNGYPLVGHSSTGDQYRTMMLGTSTCSGDTQDWGGMFMSDGGPTLSAVSSNTSVGSAASLNVAPSGMAMAKGSADLGMRSRRVQAQAVAQPVVQALGTGFGKAQDFATSTVSFSRGDLEAMIVMFYDDAAGLRARGIDLSRRAKRQETQNPVAFPGMSCVPPAGWRG